MQPEWLNWLVNAVGWYLWVLSWICLCLLVLADLGRMYYGEPDTNHNDRLTLTFHATLMNLIGLALIYATRG